MDYRPIIRSQYQAALEMLKQAISKCPETLWDDPSDKTKFWHIAFHTLFYTHLYLEDSEQEFTHWTKHRKGYQFLDAPPERRTPIEEPYTREDILAYLEFCQHQVDKKMAQLNFEAPSGFSWIGMNKFELQIYTIRHIQQHAGELMERLGTRANIELDWVGTDRD